MAENNHAIVESTGHQQGVLEQVRQQIDAIGRICDNTASGAQQAREQVASLAEQVGVLRGLVGQFNAGR